MSFRGPEAKISNYPVHRAGFLRPYEARVLLGMACSALTVGAAINARMPGGSRAACKPGGHDKASDEEE